MSNLDRTRIVFIAIIVGAVLLVACVLSAVFITNIINEAQATATSQANVLTTAVPTPKVDLKSPDPIFAPNAKLDDGLPVYVCGADAFGSYFILQQMQMSGKDVAHGFHLGIVPFSLDDNYNVAEEQRIGLLDQGKWDCLLTTLNSTVALGSPGVITAIVDESAGADQLWGRNIPTINDLKGKRIAFSRGSVGEYFMYYALAIARINPRFDVTLVPEDSVSEAVKAFNEARADAVSGWEPDIYDAAQGGGQVLLSSAQLRVVMDVIVTSRQAINAKPDLVQAFHDAWFDTLKAQMENFDEAAQQIAAWGHNDWSYVYPDTASKDLKAWLGTVAQADLDDNIFVMRDTTPLVIRLKNARRVWAASGATVPQDAVEELIDPSFVARSAAQNNLKSSANPLNDSFSLTAKLDLSGVNTAAAETLAVLPCRNFTFLPESTELTLESRRVLDDCVAPILQENVGLLLSIKGSAAWPGPAGTYTEDQIKETAEGRAASVKDYLVTLGLDPARFVVTATLPPKEHWETEDPTVQAEDRYVEMTLITVGR